MEPLDFSLCNTKTRHIFGQHQMQISRARELNESYQEGDSDLRWLPTKIVSNWLRTGRTKGFVSEQEIQQIAVEVADEVSSRVDL